MKIVDFRRSRRSRHRAKMPHWNQQWRAKEVRGKAQRGLSNVMILNIALSVFVIALILPDFLSPTSQVSAMVSGTAGKDVERASFGHCHTGGGTNCVVDGDTFWYAGRKIRIADIDTPETHPPRCAEEARLGAAATDRLHSLLNSGPFSLQQIDRDQDKYGRSLRIVTRNGESLGGVLVNENLARWYQGGRRPWC
jgi:micrococcal nuclease